MHNGVMQAWLDSSYLAGANATYVEDLYEAYLADPESVPEQWQTVFNGLPVPEENVPDQPHSQVRDYFRRLAKDTSRYATPVSDPHTDAKQVKVLQLINAYRFRGHQNANLDPLGLWDRKLVAELDPAFHNLTGADLDATFNVGSYAIGQETMKLKDLVSALKKTYCGSVGAEYMHITSTREKRWIQSQLEPVVGDPKFTQADKLRFLDSLNAAEGLEKYLGAKFPGAKRFSLEGGDALVPMTKELIRRFGENGGREVVIGMAHRGRLNMLVNVLGKRPQDLFDAFAGKYEVQSSGDVKYHMGFSSDFETPGGSVHLALAFNPSHLEIVNPVVIGANRLASNGLLEALVFARICADGIAAAVPETTAPPIDIAFEKGGTPPDPASVAELRHTMTDLVGVVRNADGLKSALRKIAALEGANNTSVSFLNMTATATLITVSALRREESRGAHSRSDFPDSLPGVGQRSRLTLKDALAIRSKICEEAS